MHILNESVPRMNLNVFEIEKGNKFTKAIRCVTGNTSQLMAQYVEF